MLLSFSIAFFVFAALVGVLYLIRTYSRPAVRAQISRDDTNNDNGQDGGGGDGGIDYDPDAPLDLPPGVYVLPKEPVGISK
ncbi:MAG: hypothetical protein AAGD28_13320 [Bacteroidota bacterium]